MAKHHKNIFVIKQKLRRFLKKQKAIKHKGKEKQILREDNEEKPTIKCRHVRMEKCPRIRKLQTCHVEVSVRIKQKDDVVANDEPDTTYCMQQIK